MSVLQDYLGVGSAVASIKAARANLEQLRFLHRCQIWLYPVYDDFVAGPVIGMGMEFTLPLHYQAGRGLILGSLTSRPNGRGVMTFGEHDLIMPQLASQPVPLGIEELGEYLHRVETDG